MRRPRTFLLLSASLLMLLALAIYALSDRWSDRPSDGAESISALVSANRPVVTSGQSSELPVAEGTSGSQAVHPLDPLLDYAREIRQHMLNDVRDYTATLVKRERIRGSLGGESRMELKVRQPQQGPAGTLPLAAYMKFTEPRSTAGREVIWVEGENANKLISHEAGLLNLKRFELDPHGMLAMLGNKYPVTEIGLLRLVEKLIEKGERDRDLGDCRVETIAGQRVGDRECTLFQVTHPQEMAGFDFHIAQIFVDVERKVPLRYAAFLWPEGDEEAPLEEEYTYLDLELNVGLTAEDFDPENPLYDFP